MSGNRNFDPGVALDKPVNDGTMCGKFAAEDPVMMRGSANFDPEVDLAYAGGTPG